MVRATCLSKSSLPGAIASRRAGARRFLRAPAMADAFRYRKISRVKPKGGSVVIDRGPSSDQRRPRRRRAASRTARWRRLPIRAKAAERALEGRTLDAASVTAAVAAAAEGLRPPTIRSPAPGIGAKSSASICAACCIGQDRDAEKKPIRTPWPRPPCNSATTAARSPSSSMAAPISLYALRDCVGDHDAQVRLRPGRMRRLHGADRRRGPSSPA